MEHKQSRFLMPRTCLATYCLARQNSGADYHINKSSELRGRIDGQLLIAVGPAIYVKLSMYQNIEWECM